LTIITYLVETQCDSEFAWRGWVLKRVQASCTGL